MDDLLRLQLIVSARQLGFSISELRKLVELDGDGLKDEAQKRATELRSTIANLSNLAKRLDALSMCDCAQPSQCRAAELRS